MVRTNTPEKIMDNGQTEKAVQVLSEGGLILFPTDTVWSVGCDIRNPDAIDRLIHICGKKTDFPVTLLADALARIRFYTGPIHPRIETLLSFHTRPLTLVYPKAPELLPGLKQEDGSVAFRLVQDPYCRQIIRQLDRPVATLPACGQADPIPGNFGSISSDLLSSVDFVAPYRQNEKGKDELAVMATYDEKGELEFIRE